MESPLARPVPRSVAPLGMLAVATVAAVVAALLCIAWMVDAGANPGIWLAAVPVLAIVAFAVTGSVRQQVHTLPAVGVRLHDLTRTMAVVALLLFAPTVLISVVGEDAAGGPPAWEGTDGAPRDIGAACPAGRVPSAGVADVEPGSGHAGSIACAVWWGIMAPAAPAAFAPAAPVSRGEMAGVMASLASAVRAPLPALGPRSFDDLAGSPHQASINRLARAGLVGGTAERMFSPTAPASRAQALALVVRVLERSAGERSLPSAPAAVADPDRPDAGVIATAAGLGVIADDEALRATDPVTRAELATMIARALSAAVESGAAQVPSGR